MDGPLENMYFDWLYSKIANPNASAKRDRYCRLFRLLYQTEFIYLVSGDDNRVEDGTDLRLEFFYETQTSDDGYFLSQPCSVLEMLIAFSRKASFETDDHPTLWFWIMLSNLGIDGLNDARLVDMNSVQAVVDHFVWRRYDGKGRGGLFPLLHSKQDQALVELWYQFNQYLIEKRYC